MTDKTETATHVNSATPESVPDAGGLAAEQPCGCGDRLDRLELLVPGVERVARMAGYLSIICAAAVLYLLWADGFSSKAGGS